MKKGILKSIMAVAAIIVVLLLVTLPLSACGNNSASSTSDEVATTATTSGETAEAESSEAAMATQSTEIKLTDGLGKEVVLDKSAEKILVFVPSALEIIDGLNAMDTVIGVDNWSVDNKEPLAEGFEGFGDFQTLNMEKITAAAPDIIIGLVGWAEADIQKLTDLGIKIYVVDANTIDEVYIEIINMGKILGKDAEAQGLVDELKKQVEVISQFTTEQMELNLDRLRGGAPPVPYGTDQYLSIVHEVIQIQDNTWCNNWRRMYIHRFILYNKDMFPIKYSNQFFIFEKGIEYVSGMVREVQKKQLIIVLGLKDSEAWLIKIETSLVDRILMDFPKYPKPF